MFCYGQFVFSAQLLGKKNKEDLSELKNVKWFNVVSGDLFTPIYLPNASNFLEL